MQLFQCRFTELSRIMNMSARELPSLFKGMKAERVTRVICDQVSQIPSPWPSTLPFRAVDGQLDHQLSFISNI